MMLGKEKTASAGWQQGRTAAGPALQTSKLPQGAESWEPCGVSGHRTRNQIAKQLTVVNQNGD